MTLTKYVIRGAIDDDAEQLAPIMRDFDRMEVWASSMKTPLEALQAGLQTADEAYTALADGVPFCMFGVSPMTILGGVASPWLLTSQDIRAHQRELLKWSRKVAHHWIKEGPYSLLLNFIDARHKPGLRWARWVGFTVRPAVVHGPFQMDFHPIEMRKTDV